MITIKWLLRLIRDLVLFGIVNRAMGMSIAVLCLLFLGVIIIAAKIAAPLIYTLF